MSTAASGDDREAVGQSLCNMCGELLGVGNVTETDNFFDLGGDSLTAIDLLQMVTEMYKVVLAVHVVFDSADLAELADSVIAQRLDAVEAES